MANTSGRSISTGWPAFGCRHPRRTLRRACLGAPATLSGRPTWPLPPTTTSGVVASQGAIDRGPCLCSALDRWSALAVSVASGLAIIRPLHHASATKPINATRDLGAENERDGNRQGDDGLNDHAPSSGIEICKNHVMIPLWFACEDSLPHVVCSGNRQISYTRVGTSRASGPSEPKARWRLRCRSRLCVGASGCGFYGALHLGGSQGTTLT